MSFEGMFRRLTTIARVACACAILIGAFIRIDDVATKTLFSDEAFSVLRITGHSEAQVRALADGRVRPVAALQAMQRPDAHTSLGATLASIGTEEPQRGPLYYGAATLWLRVAGTSIAGLRSLAVVIGLLTIAAAYGFGRVAFKETRGGLALAALVAVSPFHLAYARQAREYGLFTLAIFASATALLWALQKRSVARHVWLAIGVVVGLLTTPLFALVLAAYALYVVAVARRAAMRETLIACAGSFGAALLVVAPWYAYVARVSSKVGGETAWGDLVYPLKAYVEKLVFETGAVFFDFEFAHVRFGIALVAVFAAVAVLIVCARNDRNVSLFAMLLAAPTVVVLVGNDARAGAHFATIARYATPVWVALEIIVVSGVVAAARSARTRMPAAVSFAALLVSGGFCAFADRPYVQWWDNNDNVPIAQTGDVANRYARGIVLASKLPLALSLAHYLQPSLRVQLYRDEETPKLWPSGDPNMLFVPTPQIRAAIAAASRGRAMEQRVIERYPNITSGFHASLVKHSAAARSFAYDYIAAGNALWIVPNANGRERKE